MKWPLTRGMNTIISLVSRINLLLKPSLNWTLFFLQVSDHDWIFDPAEEEEEEEEEDNDDDDDGSRGGGGEQDEQGSKEEKGQEFSMANFNEVLLGSKNKSQKDDTPDRW